MIEHDLLQMKIVAAKNLPDAKAGITSAAGVLEMQSFLSQYLQTFARVRILALFYCPRIEEDLLEIARGNDLKNESIQKMFVAGAVENLFKEGSFTLEAISGAIRKIRDEVHIIVPPNDSPIK